MAAPKRSIGSISGANGVKVDNNPQAFRAKVKIRENVLAVVAEQGQVRVFDAFAGSGEMYSAVWRRADVYVGCDQKPQNDERLMFCADNRRVMRAIDLAAFNVFDLDAYGSPWEQAITVAARRQVNPGEYIGLMLTEGSGLHMKANGIPNAIHILTGIKHGAVGISRAQDAIIDRCVVGIAKRMKADVVARWQVNGKTGAVMRYIGLVLRGRGG